jgi:sugar O-acyltransferase (sialic acid O-acetyltransferase NeuD family)
MRKKPAIPGALLNNLGNAMKEIIILGTGGNCIDILDTINEINDASKETVYRCLGFLDDDQKLYGKEFCEKKVLGALISAVDYPECFFVNGIGSADNFWRKREIIAKTKIPDERFELIVHPRASVSKMSELGFGTVIFQNATIASNVMIGNHVIVLPNSIVSHDGIIGDYGCIAGGVCVSGGVHIGDSCYLGTNSSIKGNVAVGEKSLVGMGSVVLEDVPANSVVAGNPARFLRKTVID